MPGFGFGTRRQRRRGLSAGGFTPPTGFAMNGASNTAMKAMITRVKGNAGRGRIVWKGDSLIVGQGGGTNADSYGLTGARTNRVPAVLASLLSGAGIATLDNAMFGDSGVNQASSFPYTSYDPRFVSGNGDFQVVQNFAGGAFRNPGTTADSYTPTVAVDRFEVVIYNSNSWTWTPLVDGAVPTGLAISGTTGTQPGSVSGNTIVFPGAGTGFTRVIITCASAAAHTLSWTASAVGFGAIRSARGYATTVNAIDLLVHASCGDLGQPVGDGQRMEQP